MKDKDATKIIKRLFLSLLPVQALATGLPAINTLVSSCIIGNVLGSPALAAIGFCVPFTYIIMGCSNIIAVGSQLQCGKYLGKGDEKAVNKVFSTAITLCFSIGLLLSFISAFFSETLASMLGATDELLSMTSDYLKGYSLCCLASVFSSTIIPFLQLDCAKKISSASILTMVAGNIVFNLLNAFVLNWGLFGVGLASTTATILSVIVCIPHFTKHSKLFRFTIKNFTAKEVKSITVFGMNSALIYVFLTIRDRIFISVLLNMGGTVALSAFTIATNLANSIGCTIQNGANGACNLISSVLVGSRDVESLRDLPKIVIKSTFPIFLLSYLIIFIFAIPIARMFGADPVDIAVFVLAIRWFNGWFITNIFKTTAVSIYTSLKKIKEVGILNFLGLNGYFIICVMVAKYIGSLKLLFCFAFMTELMQEITLILYYRIKAKRMPKLPYDYIYISRDFSVPKSDTVAFTLKTVEDAAKASENIVRFCKEKGMSDKNAYWCGLCVEEMTTDTITRAFPLSKNKDCTVDVRLFYENGHVSIMLRDNCNYFNPNEWIELHAADDPSRSIGIKMVKKLAQEMNYNSTLGMNVLTIKIS